MKELAAAISGTRVEFADWSPDGTKLAVVHEVNGRKQLEYPVGKVL